MSSPERGGGARYLKDISRYNKLAIYTIIDFEKLRGMIELKDLFVIVSGMFLEICKTVANNFQKKLLR